MKLDTQTREAHLMIDPCKPSMVFELWTRSLTPQSSHFSKRNRNISRGAKQTAETRLEFCIAPDVEIKVIAMHERTPADSHMAIPSFQMPHK